MSLRQEFRYLSILVKLVKLRALLKIFLWAKGLVLIPEHGLHIITTTVQTWELHEPLQRATTAARAAAAQNPSITEVQQKRTFSRSI